MHVFTLPTRGDFYGDIHSLAVTPDGRGLRAALGYFEGPHRLVSWDLAENKATRRENIVTDREHGLCRPPPLFALRGPEGAARKVALRGPEGAARKVALRGPEGAARTGTPDFAVIVFGNCVKRAGKKRRVVLVPPADSLDGYCEPGAITPDGAFVVGGVNAVLDGERWPVHVWSLADAFAPGVEELPAARTLLMPAGEHASGFAVTKAGTLGVLSKGVTLYRHRFDTFEPLPTAFLPGEGGYAGRLLPLPDGVSLAAVNRSGVHLVGPDDTEPRLTIETGPVRDLAFTPAGDRLIVATPKGGVAVWDARTGGRLAAYKLRKLVGPVGAVAVSPDGLTAFAGGTKGRVVRFDLEA